MALMVSQLERQGWFATGQIRRAGGSKGWRSLGRRVLLFQTEVGASREDLLPVPQWHPGVRGSTIGVGPSLALRIFPVSRGTGSSGCAKAKLRRMRLTWMG